MELLIIQISLCPIVLLLKLCQKHTATTEDSLLIHHLASRLQLNAKDPHIDIC